MIDSDQLDLILEACTFDGMSEDTPIVLPEIILEELFNINNWREERVHVYHTMEGTYDLMSWEEVKDLKRSELSLNVLKTEHQELLDRIINALNNISEKSIDKSKLISLLLAMKETS